MTSTVPPSKQSDPHKKALFEAAHQGNLKRVQELIAEGVSVDVQDEGWKHWTPLFWAIVKNHPRCARLFVTLGADVNAEDDHGWRPLHVAANLGFTRICKMLLESGASLAAEDHAGWNALHAAAWGGHENTALYLLDRGADLQAVTKNGETAATVAFNHPSMRSILERRLLGDTRVDEGFDESVSSLSL